LTALAFELVIGTPEHFAYGILIASYVGLVPAESRAAIVGDWVTSASKATHCCTICWWKQRRSRCAARPECRSKSFHLAMRRGQKIAEVAMARKLAVHLYWMWRR
jgi:hypothetical protein